MKKRNIVICLILLIIISSMFVLKTSYFQGHDLDFHLSRIISMKDCMELKKICHVAPNYLNGYGYGTPLFYPEIFLIVPSLLLYLGFPLTTSYKIFLFLINSLTILSMYFCVNKLTKSKEKSLLSSFLYGFCSYRVIDMTTRGALGEAISFIFFPFVILGIYEIVYGKYSNYKYLILGMSGIILSHVLSSVIIFMYLVVFCLLNIKKLFKDRKRIQCLLFSAGMTFLITCFFTIPMLEQLFNDTYKLSRETTILKDRAIYFYDIFLGPYFVQIIHKDVWNPGSIGAAIILIIILFFMKEKKEKSSFVKQNIIISVFFIFITTNIFPWQLFQNSCHFIQFPWRFNIIPSVLIPFVGYSVIDKYEDIKKYLVILIVVFCFFSIHSITIYKNVNYVDKDKYSEYDIMWEDYLPQSLSSSYIKNRKDIISSNKDIRYTYKRKNNQLIIDFENNNINSSLELPFVYYKGYSAYMGKKKINTYESLNGLVGITIDKKYHKGKIKVFYEGTIIQKISMIISIISLIVYILFNKKIIKIK